MEKRLNFCRENGFFGLFLFGFLFNLENDGGDGGDGVRGVVVLVEVGGDEGGGGGGGDGGVDVDQFEVYNILIH
ncbi:hypothetical protein L1887_32101 [Cichorium endivia]|nr:hypothetical protein L1887_32101 [Cichorium endivia]